jgi:OmcA/MtrC family decaheme c-type cytochrome
MTGSFRYLSGLVLVTMLAACGGGGGGDAAPGVQPGPPPPGTTPPPAPSNPSATVAAGAIAADDEVTSAIVSVSLASPPVITFSVLVDGYLTVTDLTTANVRFSLAQLIPAMEPGGLDWQSLINTREDPVCRSQADVNSANNACTAFTAITDPALVPQSALKVQDPVATGKVAVDQATTERNGALTRNGDGTWRYAMTTNPGVAANLANVHRVCIQFSLAATVQNPCVDFIPAEVAAAGDGETGTSLETNFYATHPSRQVAATASCTTCHDVLAFHGGGRREVGYCVACHNPGSSDANSGNSVDLKVMIHRIHNGVALPSVMAGMPYKIWGFGNSEHDYSHVRFPQRIANCTRCHAGQADFDAALAAGQPAPAAVLTADGHNWALRPSAAACTSCHENEAHIAAEGSPCADCHSDGGLAGSVADSHRDLIRDGARAFRYEILNVSSTAPGQSPVVDFRVVDPTRANSAYDILTEAPFRQGGGASTLNVRFAWSTRDYTNTGNGATSASSASVNALTAATALGSNTFRVTAPGAIPDGTLGPFVAATGSGVVTIEGHPAEDVDPRSAGVERLPVANAFQYFSIDESAGTPAPRRAVVALARCLSCHATLSLHGNNRTDSIEGCVTCHNPRNTDRDTRAVAMTAPTDGKIEESLDFKTMIHGIHAAGVRERPLQLVGFQGRSTYVYDEDEVQYPGRLADCTACHSGPSYALPLARSVLGTSVDTGTSAIDPADDTVVSPATAVCSSCHDDAVARSHMVNNGGDFATSQSALDDGSVVEQCEVCHRAGSIAALDVVHGLP